MKNKDLFLKIIGFIVFGALVVGAATAYAAESLMINTHETLIIDTLASQGDLRRAQELGKYTLRIAPEKPTLLPDLTDAVKKFPPYRLEVELDIKTPKSKIADFMALKPNMFRFVSSKKVTAADISPLAFAGAVPVQIKSPDFPEQKLIESAKNNKVLLVGWDVEPAKIDKNMIKQARKILKKTGLAFRMIFSEKSSPSPEKCLSAAPKQIGFVFRANNGRIPAKWLEYLKAEQKKGRRIDITFDADLAQRMKDSLKGFSELGLVIKTHKQKGVYPHLIDILKEIGHPTRKPLSPATPAKKSGKRNKNDKSDRVKPEIK